ncbi:FAD-binding domain-containing protein [Corynespora cassiicola Philippines]|uniref:FAD-binding domain-containing protein n=1 Tax=Corynespora cassiicola Philippines TaxID=1448308 RepID=A0A2T2PDY7_CORCC|nr:FAD-binding domain-containing protein [Corynespora cassiicola Philippines]
MVGINCKWVTPCVFAIFISSYLCSTQHTVQAITGFRPCDALISAGFTDRVILATSEDYEDRVAGTWAANARFRPWCFVQPHNTQELSGIIKALESAGSGAGDWHIAVRSGGHHFAGTNGIANGVTIDLAAMNSSSFDPENKIASVEPGARWKDVYSNLLDIGNVTVTGGRDGNVGVGGFLVGGGNSYFSGRTGFGADNVVNFEVVLSNGTIVDANTNEHHELWKALKGGGLNFGIVTRFDIQTIPAVDLAFGSSVISFNHSDRVIDAFVEFADLSEELGADAMIVVYTHDMELNEEDVIVVVRANTEGNLNTTSFDKLNAIPNISSEWVHRSLADIANSSQIEGNIKVSGAALTFLNSPFIFRYAVNLNKQLISRFSRSLGAENFGAQMFIQPLPKYFGDIGERKGGNVLGLNRIPSNAAIWSAGIWIKNGTDADLAVIQAEVHAMAAELRFFAEKQDTAVEFVYLNYADPSQDALGSYGPENVAFMKEVAKKYDPQGWWQRRTPGGFKLSRVDD